MAKPKTSLDRAQSFDVLVERVVGTIALGEGEQPAVEAAFALIARQGEDGTYHFPGPDGQNLHVDVTGWQTPEQDRDAQDWRDSVLA